MTQRRLSESAVAFAGVLLLAWAGYSFIARARFASTATPASGRIAWVTRFHIGVTPDGEQHSVSARRPPFHLYRTGQRVDILYDREKFYPGQLRSNACVRSFAGLWLGPILLSIAGGLLMAGRLRNGRLTIAVGRVHGARR